MNVDRDFARRIEPLKATAVGRDAQKRFVDEPTTLALAVVDEHTARPIGILTRARFFAKFAEELGRAIYSNRKIALMMDAKPVCIEAGASFGALKAMVERDGESAVPEAFIVTEGGRYLGVGDGKRLIHDVMATTQVAMANLSAYQKALDQHAIVAIVDRFGKVVFVNDGFCEISGFAREELIGQDHSALRWDQDGSVGKEAWRHLLNGESWRGELCHRNKIGQVYWLDATIIPTFSGHAKPDRFISICHDITAHKIAQANANTLARLDSLTGLGNRLDLIEALQDRETRSDKSFGLILIDLDRFKPINDVYGHLVGDQVLQAIATRLRGVLNPACTIVRLGGDEFAIVTHSGCDEARVRSKTKRILDAIHTPIQVSGATLAVGASIGVAMYPADARSPQQLLHYADAAMYRAKQRRGDVQFFDAAMDQGIRERAAIESELRRAIVLEEIVPHFQPIVSLSTGEVVGHEVLARWKHAERGFISPSVFIPIAEEAGLIDTIFWRLMRSACAEHLKARMQTLLSFNISPAQIKNPYFAQKIVQVLTELRFPASRLEVEVTETSMIDDIDRVRPVLQSLKNQGVRIALDDFGTGHSSLVLLRDLPFDKVKIDRSFVMGMAADKRADGTIVNAVLGMAAALGLEVTAEGVECESAAAMLRDKRCHYGQGYFFGYAEPAAIAFSDVALSEVAVIIAA